jgi:hypothetical protein
MIDMRFLIFVRLDYVDATLSEGRSWSKLNFRYMFFLSSAVYPYTDRLNEKKKSVKFETNTYLSRLFCDDGDLTRLNSYLSRNSFTICEERELETFFTWF